MAILSFLFCLHVFHFIPNNFFPPSFFQLCYQFRPDLRIWEIVFFRCGHCKAPFESEIEVKRHFRQVHSDKPPPPPKSPSTSPPKKPKKKVCEECGVATYALKNHILAFHSDKIFKCDECGKIYNSPYLLKGHINNVSLDQFQSILGPFKVQFKSISVLYFNYFFFLIFRSILKFPVRCAAKWSAKANSITTCNKNTCRPVRKSTNVTIVAKVSVKQVGCAITSTCTLVKSLTNVDFATLDLQALATKQRMNEVIWDWNEKVPDQHQPKIHFLL